MFGVVKNYFKLKNQNKQIRNEYEKKKEELLLLYRTESNKSDQLRLIHEINILAEILKDVKINIDEIPETLRVYPTRIKR